MAFLRKAQHRLVVILTVVLLGATALVIGLQRRVVAAVERYSADARENVARQRLEHLTLELRRLFDGAVLDTLFAASAEMPSSPEDLVSIGRHFLAGHRYPYVERFFFWNRFTTRIAGGEVLFFRPAGESGPRVIDVALGDGAIGGFYRRPGPGRALAMLTRSFGRPEYRVSYAVVEQDLDGVPYQIVVRWWWTGEREQTFAASGYLVNLQYIRTRFFADLFSTTMRQSLEANQLASERLWVRDETGRLVFGAPVPDGVDVEQQFPLIFFPLTSRPTRLMTTPQPRAWTIGLHVADAAETGPQLSLVVGYWLSGGAVFLILVAFGLSVSANREAVRLAEIRADLVASVTHELRTPLSLLNLAGETMAVARTQDPARMDEYIGVVRRESAQLMKLVDKTLELSRIESGQRALRLERTELNELVAHIVSRFRDRLADRAMLLRVTAYGDDLYARVDAMALEHALFNLLDNAVRYGSSSSGVDVRVAAAGGLAIVDVVDYGLGIPADELPHIFDKFFRGSNNGSARSGFGLGLSIVQQMVEAQRGSVEVESVPGRSTRFRILLRRVPGPSRG